MTVLPHDPIKWLIRIHDQDAEASDKRPLQLTETSFFRLSLRKPLFVAFSFSILFSVPFAVHAGFFSFMESLFHKSVSASVGKTVNSQNISLLQASLNHDPNPSKGGGDIVIVDGQALLPEAGPTGATGAGVASQKKNNNGEISIYVVREGDSLSQIAEMYGVTSNTIIWSNDIKRGTLITPGQTLVIMPVSGIQHTVVKGDTILSINKKYKGSLAEVMEYNGLAENATLVVGDTVFIPDGEPTVISTPRTIASGGSSPSVSSSGYFINPLPGGIKTQGIHGYNGVDYGAPVGTAIYASASGEVLISKSSGWNGGYGQYVVIKHANGTQTLYAHLSSNSVSAGQSVTQGQVVGGVGSTGRSTGSHLHFEVRGARNPF